MLVDKSHPRLEEENEKDSGTSNCVGQCGKIRRKISTRLDESITDR